MSEESVTMFEQIDPKALALAGVFAGFALGAMFSYFLMSKGMEIENELWEATEAEEYTTGEFDAERGGND